MALNTFTAGTTASASEVNDNFTRVACHRKKFSDATLRADDSGAWVDSGTAVTLTVPIGALIIGLRFKARFTTNGAQTVEINLKLIGTNLGTIYVSTKEFLDANRAPGITTTEEAALSENNVTDAIQEMRFNPCLEILDTSTAITVRMKSNDVGNNQGFDNLEIDVIYINGFIED